MGKDHGSEREQNCVGFHSPSRGRLSGRPFFYGQRVGSGRASIGSGRGGPALGGLGSWSYNNGIQPCLVAGLEQNPGTKKAG